MSRLDQQTITPMDGALGRAIRISRIARGQTQAQTASALQITPQQLQKYETAKNRVGAVRLIEIARALDISADTLLQAATAIGPQPATPRAAGDRRRIHIARDIALLPAATQDALARLVRTMVEQHTPTSSTKA